ncbi:pimeloyl-ACP methyl ester carboxylesterase [Paraburkholderia sp. GAS41]|jgi:pimeloyl-ACP methyl ester carboxylesterase|uniref:acetoin dehydrogenase dihydrolipoyllysine-residue acetyltransferase subunit n=1 Tax=Paraburkholderia sp. GAS41 TaxID=3035134 RepID=UPI003D1BA1E7
MPTEVILPRVDMDMSEGMIAAWHVEEGDEVREGMLIFEIETSKATMEIDAPASGIIRQISAPVGKTVPVGTAVAWIYAAGEALSVQAEVGLTTAQDEPMSVTGLNAVQNVPMPVTGLNAAQNVPIPVADAALQETAQARAIEAYQLAALCAPHACAREGSASNPQEPLRATPAARRLVRERGLRLVDIAGSGPHGRVVAQDVLRTVVQPDGSGPARHAASRACLHSVTLRKGSGDPLVLLHGFAAESNSWRPFSQAVASVSGAEPGMLAVDLPAHGKSTAQAAGSLDDMVAVLEHTLLDAGITRCHLVGHSFGGALALATTARASRVEVRSLALLAPAGLGPGIDGAFLRGLTEASSRASLAVWLRQLFADPTRMDDGFVATAWQQLESAQVRNALAAVADRFFPDGTQLLDLRQLLTGLTLPVRVVWGEQDRIVPVRHADELPGHVAVHRFAGVGHLPHVEAQAQVAALVVQNIAAATAGHTQACSVSR